MKKKGRQMILAISLIASLTCAAQMNSDWVNSMQFKPIPYQQKNPIDVDNVARVFSQLATQHESQQQRFDELFDKGVSHLDRGSYVVAKLYFEQCLEINEKEHLGNTKVIKEVIKLCEEKLSSSEIAKKNRNSQPNESQISNHQATSEKVFFQNLFRQALNEFEEKRYVDAKASFNRCLEINKKYRFMDDLIIEHNISLCENKLSSQ